jgi:hypothetical protein
MKSRGTTAIILAAFTLVLSAVLVCTAGAAPSGQSIHAFVTCQYSPVGASGPISKPAPAKGCVKTSYLNPAAVVISSVDTRVRFCVIRYDSALPTGRCSKERVAPAGQEVLYRLPAHLGHFTVQVFENGKQISKLSYRVRPPR